MSGDPPTAFLHGVLGQVNRDDLVGMVEAQRAMLMRFEKSNEMLLNFNALSSARYQTTAEEFRQHTQVLADMKRDLDMIFRRIRTLKTKLGKAHPEAFQACSDVYNVLEEDEDSSGQQTEAPPVVGTVTSMDSVIKVVCESGVNPMQRIVDNQRNVTDTDAGIYQKDSECSSDKPLQDRSLIQSTKDESIHTTNVTDVTLDSKNSNSNEVSNLM